MRNRGLIDPEEIEEYIAMSGYTALAKALTSMTAEEIISEIKHALQSCGRQMGRHIRAVKREGEEARKRQYIEKYLPHIGIALKDMLGLTDRQRDAINDKLERLFEKKAR